MNCNCRDCKFWHSDEPDPEQSMRGYCWQPAADKAGDRTVFDYSCRHWERRNNETESGSNIDDVRSEIMRLESAAHFDAGAWSRVLADLSAAGRFSALDDAKRRMETARSNQPAVGLDIATGQDKTVVSIVAVETDKERRLRHANDLLKVIAQCGRHFFSHNKRISHFELDTRGRVWFVDAYREDRIYTHYTRGRWHGFSEGGTLRDLVIRLRDFITKGATVGRVFGPYPDWYCDGDPWGYGADMQRVFDAALEMGVVEAPADACYRIANMATTEVQILSPRQSVQSVEA